MIIVQLTGGLGNQMFQYALGRSLAHHHNSLLKMDITYYNSQGPNVIPRTYELDCFNINQSFASREEISFIKNQKSGWLQKTLGKISPTYLSVYKEKNNSYNIKVFSTSNNIYLKGYWQNEKYFKNIETLIREEYAFKHSLSPKAKSLLKEIETGSSVSIHIRRTDYIGKAVEKVCSKEYYNKAIQHIAGQIDNIQLYIFSDDIDWAKSNLEFSHPTTFVDKYYTENISWIDMQLMSKCKHCIIANSTFSWWAAWLNNNPDKIVVAPNEWNFKKDIKEIIPSEWITI